MLTVLPKTGLLLASLRITVTVVRDVPLADTLSGDTVTLLFLGSTVLPTRLRTTVALLVSMTLALTDPLAEFSRARAVPVSHVPGRRSAMSARTPMAPALIPVDSRCPVYQGEERPPRRILCRITAAILIHRYPEPDSSNGASRNIKGLIDLPRNSTYGQPVKVRRTACVKDGTTVVGAAQGVG